MQMARPRPRSRPRMAARHREAASVELCAAATSPGRSARRALVMEADPETQRLCRDVLESLGFVVDAVDSGIAALVAARKGLPDLILMDLQLRDVPGREAIAWLRSNPALWSTPIIVLAGNSDDDADLAATRPSASLRKPVSPLAVRRTVQEVLK